MLKKIFIIIIPIAITSALLPAYGLTNHALGEEVCDMHAYTQYNKHLLIHDINPLDNALKSYPYLGNKNSQYEIVQFCDLTSPNCIKNNKHLMDTISKHKNTKLFMFYNSSKHNLVSEYAYEASLTAYIIGGDDKYIEFINLASEQPMKTKNDVEIILKALNIDNSLMDKYKSQTIKMINISKQLSKDLKITHNPSLYIMPTSNQTIKNVYFSEHEDVPNYIIDRAFNYLQVKQQGK